MGFFNKLLGRNQASPQRNVGAQLQPHRQNPQSPYHRGGTGVANGRTFTQQSGQTNNRFIKQTFEFMGANVAKIRDNNNSDIEHVVLFNEEKTKIVSLLYANRRQAVMDFQEYLKDGLQVGNLKFQKTTNSVAFIIQLDDDEYITLNREDLNP